MSEEIIITPDGKAVVTQTQSLGDVQASVDSGDGFVSLGKVTGTQITFRSRTEDLLQDAENKG